MKLRIAMYKRADWDSLGRNLELTPWNMLEDMELDHAVDTFYDLNAAVRDHVPTIVLRREYPAWFDGELKQTLSEKEVAFRRKKRNVTPYLKMDFREKRRKFKNISCSKYFNDLKRMIGDF